MTLKPPPQDELRDLLWSIEDGSISAAGIGRIDELVCGDPELLRQYIEYTRLLSDLRFGPTGGRAEDVLGRLFDIDEGSGVRGQGPGSGIRDLGFGIWDSESPAPSPEPLIPPVIIDSSPTTHYPLFTTHSSLGGWAFSYAASTVITGLLLLVLWTWTISHEHELAKSSPLSTPPAVQPAKPTELVGRITGETDCHWAGGAGASREAAVALGRKYNLASGLLEISYDTGAKVILEGPCTYEVDSARGGFLSLGKLTARVGERGEGREESVKSEIRNPKSEPPSSSPLSPLPSPLFSVRTPTALVTDLGTEFGVEVDKFGTTRSHVFRGKVELKVVDGGNRTGEVIPLGENQSASVEAGRDGVVRAVRATGHGADPLATAFARGLPGTLMYNFDDGATHGWAPLAEYPGDKKQAYHVVSLRDVDLPGLVGGAQSGAFCVMPMTLCADPRYEYDFTDAARDGTHATCTFASPTFKLNSADYLSDLTFWLNASGTGSPAINGVLAPGTAMSSFTRDTVAGGFIGVALVDVTTGRIAIAGSADGTLSYRNASTVAWNAPKQSGFERLGGGWWQLRFTRRQLQRLPLDNVYRLVLIDNSSNAWSAMDTVSIPGYLVSIAENEATAGGKEQGASGLRQRQQDAAGGAVEPALRPRQPHEKEGNSMN